MPFQLKSKLKYTLLLSLACTIAGCNDQVELRTAPIYKECIPALENFLYISEIYNVRSSIVYFDKLSEAHSSIIGYLEMQFSDKNEIARYMNTVVAICHPEGVIEVTNSNQGRIVINNEFKSRYTGDNLGPYIVYREDFIRLYFNEKYTHWWKGFK